MEAGLGTFFMLVGGCAIVYGLVVPRWQVARAAAWPAVSGVVTTSGTETTSGGSGEMTGTANTYHVATIRYTYRVGARAYRNNKIHAGGTLSSSMPSGAAELVRRYPEGANVDVFYNPDKPAESCLEKNEQTSLICSGTGAVFLLAGWFFI